MLAFAFRLLNGMILARSIVRGARRIEESTLFSDRKGGPPNRRWRKRRAMLLQSGQVHSPVTVGWLTPSILVPPDWRRWPPEKQQSVLKHELAHIQRGDCLVALLAEINRCLHWLNPLSWFLARRLADLAERNCDDAVIAAAGDRAAYARHLLEIASSLVAKRERRLATGLRMARKAQLETRIEAILDRRRSLSRRVGWVSSLLVVSIALPLSVVFAAMRPSMGNGDQQPPAKNNTSAAQASKPTSATSSAEKRTFAGQVLDPTGKPIKGAKVFLSRMRHRVAHFERLNNTIIDQTITDPQGRFQTQIPDLEKQHLRDYFRRGPVYAGLELLATADGYGPAWTRLRESEARRSITLKLVEDLPITGRVLDLEGNPIEGASLRPGVLHSNEQEDLTRWIIAVQNGEQPGTTYKWGSKWLQDAKGLPREVVTDKEGRFRITGVGRERVLHLALTGATIAYSDVTVVTRPMRPIKWTTGSILVDTSTVYGANLQLIAAPSRPIVGTVMDAKSGKPLAGVTVQSSSFAGSVISAGGKVKTTTDAKGRYRLPGMPKGKGNWLNAAPTIEQPYFPRSVEAPDPPGLGPVQLDIELYRGIWISGRVTDKATKIPVAGATLHYLPFRTNKHAQAIPAFLSRTSDYWRLYKSQQDGSFRLLGLPGRAIVGAYYSSTPYRQGVGADKIEGMNDRGYFESYAIPPTKKWPTTMKEINPAQGDPSVEVNLQLDPGETIHISIVDPHGRPLSGYHVWGDGPRRNFEPLESPTFEAKGFGPTERRTIMITHEARKLGQIVRVGPPDAETNKLTIKLQPAATIVGRLLDANGDPVAAAVQARIMPVEDFFKALSPVSTSRDGRFRIENVPAGCDYAIVAEGSTIGFTDIARPLTVKAGQTKDLGEIRLARD